MVRSLLVLTSAALAAAAAPSAGVSFERLRPLKPNEGVFAYARISPSGRWLAYSSEMPAPGGRGITQTQTVVDLTDQRVLFTEPGIDGYFSDDDTRLIYVSHGVGPANVGIWHRETGRVTHDAAPLGLGDYFSWSVHDHRDLIMTIASRYYYLDGDRAVLPAGRVVDCPGIGVARGR